MSKTSFKTYTAFITITLASYINMCGDDGRGVSRVEFERLWSSPVEVSGKIVDYVPGDGTVLTYTYDGYMNLSPSNISVVEVRLLLECNQEDSQVRLLRISVPDEVTEVTSIFKTVGAELTMSLPLLYLSYDPWGFVPFRDINRVSRVSEE